MKFGHLLLYCLGRLLPCGRAAGWERREDRVFNGPPLSRPAALPLLRPRCLACGAERRKDGHASADPALGAGTVFP